MKCTYFIRYLTYLFTMIDLNKQSIYIFKKMYIRKYVQDFGYRVMKLLQCNYVQRLKKSHGIFYCVVQ